MTTAVREIVKQAKNLSADEQLELAAWLIGQARESTSVIEDEDEAEVWDVFSLNHVPTKNAYTMRVKYVFSGKAQPLPYQLESEE
jgi:hypothetical protein